MLSYKYRLENELSRGESEKEKNLTDFETFKQFFTVFMGILGQETKTFFTNTEATTQTLEPLKGNLAFYQTNKLLEKFDDRKVKLENFLHP